VLARGDDPTEPPGQLGAPRPAAPPWPGVLSGGTPAPAGLARFSGEVPLDQPGPFGYTVRVLPSHPLLDSRAELGLVTYPQAPAGMTNGDLR